MTDGKVISEQQVRWLISQIKEKSDLRDFACIEHRDPERFMDELSQRIESVVEICDSFLDHLETEACVSRGSSHESMVAQHEEDMRNARRD